MGRPTLNRIGAVVVTSILTMKFITDGGKVGVLRGDKQEAEKCHNAEFGAEVAGESERNEKIATKPRRPLLEPMRTHPMEPWVRI
ncbi:hypothetical protein PIB30_025401 [Stylosanthes scabra]|uniref:Uncharacterized protein n=1 Tax=Stylosanthes scabra TaxID=79078 RepID=A0ABU6RAB3_9FABA|nr:hypothetical protein [Stylosanthes scabra]